MPFSLPESVKTKLAERSMRMHHLLWHTVRDNWHKFTPEQQATFQQQHPRWVPPTPRFLLSSSGKESFNDDAGEAFLYMHRRMLIDVNKLLAKNNVPEIVPWQNIPTPDDLDYPVPGRGTTTFKNDDFYLVLQEKEEKVYSPKMLRKNSLAFIGIYVEANIHDFMHQRWAAESPGIMKNFPALDPANINPILDTSFDAVDVDWLAHPYSSHVNPIFWKLHGWCDQIIEKWRIANNLSEIKWTDTWVGGMSNDEELAFPSMKEMMKGILKGMIKGIMKGTSQKHRHSEHDHHSERELLNVFKTLNSFKGCHIGFDYATKNNIPLPELT